MRLSDDQADRAALDRRLQVASVPRELLLVTTIPGYRFTVGGTGSGYGRVAAIPPDPGVVAGQPDDR